MPRARPGVVRREAARTDHAVSEQFVKAEQRAMLLVEAEHEALLARFEAYRPPTFDKAAWARSRM